MKQMGISSEKYMEDYKELRIAIFEKYNNCVMRDIKEIEYDEETGLNLIIKNEVIDDKVINVFFHLTNDLVPVGYIYNDYNDYSELLETDEESEDNISFNEKYNNYVNNLEKDIKLSKGNTRKRG